MSQLVINLSRQSLKFLRKNRIAEETITEAVVAAVRKIKGEDVNIDLKKLSPPFDGYFRVRVGRMRITFELNFDLLIADVAEINWRGGAYK